MKTIFKTALFFSLLTFVLACKGPQGEVGPQGPQGTQGVQGAKGETGSVNITTSPWISVKDTDWKSYNGDLSYYDISFKESALTQNVLDKGLIMCYFRFNNDKKIIYPMPTYWLSSKATFSFYPTLAETEPRMVFETEFDEPTDLKGASTLDFRYLIIPEATLKSGRTKDINWQNYDEVKAALNLVD